MDANASATGSPGQVPAVAGPILVAYDGSLDAKAALEWAIREARARSGELRVLYVDPDVPAFEGPAATMSWSRATVASLVHPGEQIVAQGVAQARAAGLVAEPMVLVGPTAGMIAQASKAASLVVMGSRGVGALRGAMLGATVPHVASHSQCPVIVVREQSPLDGRVVVGVDGSPESLETLGWAFEHAQSHGLPLHVLYAYEIPIYPEVVPYVPPVEVITEVADAADHAVSDEVSGWANRYPDVPVTKEAVQDRAARALIEASQTASLVVVGSHGRGGFIGMLLGSTSQTLLHHTHCTVAVIRHPKPAKRPKR